MTYRRTVPMQITTLGEREVEILMMTGGLKDDGFDLDPQGCILERYATNPIQLWQHNPEYPVGTNDSIRLVANGIAAHTTFAPAGVSQKADEVCGLVKSGVVRACSIGFDILEKQPIDPRDPRKGWRVPKWAMLECSFVSVPLDSAALVTARAQGGDMASWKCAASRNFPIMDGDPAWDGSKAEAQIFEWAGGDEFDAAKARRCFLAYDAAAPDLRGSYKLPFVFISGGSPAVPKSALRAASGAHGVGAADIGGAKAEATAVLEAYKKKADVGQDGDGRAARAPVLRGLYGIGQLAYLLDMIGDCKNSEQVEMLLEGDVSKVPALLATAMQAMGQALLAKTEEEVAEYLEGNPEKEEMEEAVEALAERERRIVRRTTDPALRAFRVGQFAARAALMSLRAGAALSAANAEKLSEVDGHHSLAFTYHRSAVDSHDRVGGHHEAVGKAIDDLLAAHEQMADQLDGDDGDDDGDGDGDRGGRAKRLDGMPDPTVLRRAHARMGRGLAVIQRNFPQALDQHEAVTDAHRGIHRCMRAASRALRAVDGFTGEGPMPGAQVSEGESQGASDGRSAQVDDADLRRRQAARLRLMAAGLLAAE